MGSGPTLTGAECVESTRKTYISVSFDRSDWCSYSGGTCLIDHVTMDKEKLCILCKHRVPIDVPAELEFYMRQKEEESCK